MNNPIQCQNNKCNKDERTSDTEEWYALAVKFGYERVVADVLQVKKYEAFAPRFVRRKAGKQFQEAETPLFPGYTFARFDARFRLPILLTPGVRCVVGFGRIPAPIDAAEIEAIRNLVQTPALVEQCEYAPVGTRVRIIRGPLAGLEGILTETRSSLRVVLSVTVIQRSVRVEVEPDMVITCRESTAGSRKKVAC
jgi:transcription antitermination factor NusG